MTTFRSFLQLALGAALAVSATHAPLTAQVVDDRDEVVGVPTMGQRGMRMDTLADGRVVAAWVRTPTRPNPATPADQLVVAISSDHGKTWKNLYTDYVGEKSFLKQLDVTVITGSSSRYDGWVFLPIERLDIDRNGNWSRWIEIVYGPVDQPWNYLSGFPNRTHVMRESNADPRRIDEHLNLSSCAARYGNDERMLVLTYRWVENGLDAIFVSVPFTGSIGGAHAASGPMMLAGPGGVYGPQHVYAHPSIAADPAGRNLFVAFENMTTDSVEIAWADPETFQQGRSFLNPDATLSGPRFDPMRRAPEIAVHNNTAVLTCLGANNTMPSNSAPLYWYWKQRSAPWAFKSMLHGHAMSAGVIVAHEGAVFVAANVVADIVRGRSAGHTFAFHGRPRDQNLTGVRVGDQPVQRGRPALAVSGSTDRAVVAHTESDDWFAGFIQSIRIDAGR